MPQRTWMYWILFLLLVALKLPPASSSRTLPGTGTAVPLLTLAVQRHTGAAAQVFVSRHGSSSSSSSSSSSIQGRQLLQAWACSKQCAPGSCLLSNYGQLRCYTCLNGFEPTVQGSCGCPGGRYPVDSLGTVTCVRCPAGSWCPGGTDSAGSGINSCSNGLTSKQGAKTTAQCVNPPGFYYSATTAAAVQCPPNTYSTGFGWQSSCASCPGGLMTLPADIGPYTSAAACRLKPGYYLRSWQPVVCNQGSWNAGLNRVATCTPCAANVTTTGPGATSAADCRYLVKGYEAVTVAVSGEITAVRPCRQNAYCPGYVTAPGWTACPRGMWTKSGGRTAQNECFTPPGYFLPADGTSNITKCTTGVNGAYKSGWGSDAACTVCGPGIYSDASTNVTVYDPVTDTSTPDYVASDVSACFVYPGMGMAHQLRRVGNGYQFVGAKCNRVEGVNQHSTFGYTTYTRGLTVRPCRRCAGQLIGSGPVGGATGCAIPAGYAAVGYNGSVLFSTGYVWARVKNVTLCPTGFYCVGGDPTNDAAAQPAACGTGITTAGAGASDASQCNACVDTNAEYTGGSCRCKAGYTAVNMDAPSNSSLNVTWQTNQAGLIGPKLTTGYQACCSV
ncbi:hypothetical protein OEZ85_007606 [Tetradesmus obliquus]|uniref:Tyrosine-protein kinase ephrin type A/B receptor-like domain-containing protein n=1 Tax=Tetradesmus obliquus TaxID=3088 RepID=A0ABY8TIL9_TETOB|nr:hypothetical protein OEZ85_007606 [Tetradesmus obliquus]